jgi:hypothetical protein
LLPPPRQHSSAASRNSLYSPKLHQGRDEYDDAHRRQNASEVLSASKEAWTQRQRKSYDEELIADYARQQRQASFQLGPPSTSSGGTTDDEDEQSPSATNTPPETSAQKPSIATPGQDPSAVIKAYFDVNWKDDDEALATLAANGLLLEAAPRELRSHKRFVLVAVTHRGLALKHASSKLRDDDGIVWAAVASDWRSLAFASKRCREDVELAKLAVAQSPNALPLLAQPLRRLADVLLLAVTQDGRSLQYGAGPDVLGSHELVTAACLQNGLALQYASAELKDDDEIIDAAVRQNPHAKKFASERWKAAQLLAPGQRTTPWPPPPAGQERARHAPATKAVGATRGDGSNSEGSNGEASGPPSCAPGQVDELELQSAFGPKAAAHEGILTDGGAQDEAAAVLGVEPAFNENPHFRAPAEEAKGGEKQFDEVVEEKARRASIALNAPKVVADPAKGDEQEARVGKGSKL